MLHWKFAATERFAERHRLVHHQVDPCSFEEGVVLLLDNHDDITGIPVRLKGEEEEEEEEEG